MTSKTLALHLNYELRGTAEKFTNVRCLWTLGINQPNNYEIIGMSDMKGIFLRSLMV